MSSNSSFSLNNGEIVYDKMLDKPELVNGCMYSNDIMVADYVRIKNIPDFKFRKKISSNGLYLYGASGFLSENIGQGYYSNHEKLTNKEAFKNEWFKNANNIIKEDLDESGNETYLERYFINTLNMKTEDDFSYGAMLIQDYFMANVNNDQKVIKILHAISHVDYELIGQQGAIIAGACLSNKNVEVIEFALKAFENWKSKSTLHYLESLHLRVGWLNAYLKKVVEYIKE